MEARSLIPSIRQCMDLTVPSEEVSKPISLPDGRWERKTAAAIPSSDEKVIQQQSLSSPSLLNFYIIKTFN